MLRRKPYNTRSRAHSTPSSRPIRCTIGPDGAAYSSGDTQNVSYSAQTSPAVATHPATARRKGLLARTRTPTSAFDAKPGPVLIAKTSRLKGGEDRNREKIATEQLLYMQEASSRSSAETGSWLGTQLFPTADADSEDDSGRKVLNGSIEDIFCESFGADDGCELRLQAIKPSGGRRRRVRTRPASWGAPRVGELGIWPGNRTHDDCSGDGDGHLELRPFPSHAELTCSEDSSESCSESGWAPPTTQPNWTREEESPTSCKTTRFLEVFSRLQPAYRALKLELPLPNLPGVRKGARGTVANLKIRDAAESIVNAGGSVLDRGPASAWPASPPRSAAKMGVGRTLTGACTTTCDAYTPPRERVRPRKECYSKNGTKKKQERKTHDTVAAGDNRLQNQCCDERRPALFEEISDPLDRARGLEHCNTHTQRRRERLCVEWLANPQRAILDKITGREAHNVVDIAAQRLLSPTTPLSEPSRNGILEKVGCNEADTILGDVNAVINENTRPSRPKESTALSSRAVARHEGDGRAASANEADVATHAHFDPSSSAPILAHTIGNIMSDAPKRTAQLPRKGKSEGEARGGGGHLARASALGTHEAYSHAGQGPSASGTVVLQGSTQSDPRRTQDDPRRPLQPASTSCNLENSSRQRAFAPLASSGVLRAADRKTTSAHEVHEAHETDESEQPVSQRSALIGATAVDTVSGTTQQLCHARKAAIAQQVRSRLRCR